MSIQSLALDASDPLGSLDLFELCSDPFCDGIGFNLLDLNFEAVRKRPEDLIATLRRKVKTLTFKWATFSHHGCESSVWLTLQPDTSKLTELSVKSYLDTRKAVQEHAMVHWGCSQEAAKKINISKLDATVDF